MVPNVCFTIIWLRKLRLFSFSVPQNKKKETLQKTIQIVYILALKCAQSLTRLVWHTLLFLLRHAHTLCTWPESTAKTPGPTSLTSKVTRNNPPKKLVITDMQSWTTTASKNPTGQRKIKSTVEKFCPRESAGKLWNYWNQCVSHTCDEFTLKGLIFKFRISETLNLEKPWKMTFLTFKTTLESSQVANDLFKKVFQTSKQIILPLPFSPLNYILESTCHPE